LQSIADSFCDCSECLGHTNLENTLGNVFADHAIEDITLKPWILTGVK
jgi:hypothetical protein